MDNIRKATLCSSLVLLSCGLLTNGAWAQDGTPQAKPVSEKVTVPSKPAAAPAKTHTVWTDDNVATLRTPADQYAAEKEASQAAANAATSVPASSSSQDSATAKSSTAAGSKSASDSIESKISNKGREIKAQVDHLALINSQLEGATGADREKLEAEQTRLQGLLDQARQELVSLQLQKAEMEKANPESGANR